MRRALACLWICALLVLLTGCSGCESPAEAGSQRAASASERRLPRVEPVEIKLYLPDGTIRTWQADSASAYWPEPGVLQFTQTSLTSPQTMKEVTVRGSFVCVTEKWLVPPSEGADQ